MLEITSASFELSDQTSVDTLVLNAELLDLVIDLFGEDNLADLEASLNFAARIQSFGEKFYSKVNKFLETVLGLSNFVN